MLLKTALLAALVLAAGLVRAPDPAPASAGDGLILTILHHNDASSRLLGPGDGTVDAGGIARFASVVAAERSKADSGPDAISITLSAGNTIEVGPTLEAGLTPGAPFYDAVALRAIGYDAVVLGDQDFGLGPDVLADLLCAAVRSSAAAGSSCDGTGRGAFPFLAANLDFTGEPRLKAFVDAGALARSTVVSKQGHEIGVVGVITPALAVISSPRNVRVDDEVAAAAQAEIDALQARGIDKIVVLAQLGSIDALTDLAASLSGADVIVGGGTGTLLADPDDTLLPGDSLAPGRPYPVLATGADGNEVPIVTTDGAFKYLGRLVLEFDAEGRITWIDPGSGPVAVTGIAPDRIIANAIERPVQAFLDSLENEVVADSAVALDGRTEVVRTRETNLGNLMADAALWQARQSAPGFGVAQPDVAILNAGGFRLETLRPAGPLTRLDTYAIAPFASFISVVEDVSPAELKLLLENAVSRLPATDGRFAQIAGMTVTFDAGAEPLAFDAAGRPLNDGSRILSVRLNDGTPIIQDGAPVPGAPDLTVATIDFLARGGDQYPFPTGFTSLGVTYQQALVAYVTEALANHITPAAYPENGQARIVPQ